MHPPFLFELMLVYELLLILILLLKLFKLMEPPSLYDKILIKIHPLISIKEL